MELDLIHRLDSLLILRTQWVQVEVTTACNAACLYCPPTASRDIWQNRFLSLNTIRCLRPALQKTRLAYLSGLCAPSGTGTVKF